VNTSSKPKPSLTLVGSGRGKPTLDDLTALYFKLTGKTPTPEELALARQHLAPRDGYPE
jgi:hypothetical protein